MPESKITKEQLIKSIEKLEQDDDFGGFLIDVGVGAVGLGAGAAAVTAFGGTSILFGLITVAPPLGLIMGGAVAGAAALVGLKKIFFDGTYSEGQKAELLRQFREQLRDIEAKERAETVNEDDKKKFIISLKQIINYGLISPETAQELIKAVYEGEIEISEAIRLIESILLESAQEQYDLQSKLPEENKQLKFQSSDNNQFNLTAQISDDNQSNPNCEIGEKIMPNIEINDNVAHPLALFRNHLEFHGYRVQEDQELIFCRHQRKHNLVIRNVPERGVLISTMYNINEAIKRIELLEFLNRINSELFFSKAYADEENTFVVETFFEGNYDRNNFTLILDNLETDLSFIMEDPETQKVLV